MESNNSETGYRNANFPNWVVDILKKWAPSRQVTFKCPNLPPRDCLDTCPEVPLWNEKLKRLRKNGKKQRITISIAAGNYDTEIITDQLFETSGSSIKSQVLDLKTLSIFSPLKISIISFMTNSGVMTPGALPFWECHRPSLP